MTYRISTVVDHGPICDEWLQHLSTFNLEQRKEEFIRIINISSNIDSDTPLYRSNLNNFITDGMADYLHTKETAAKKSGQGLAHVRNASYFMRKPNSMNIVHKYIYAKILQHSQMQEHENIPEKIDWEFMFNLPNYVNNEKLLSEDEIPSLPKPSTRPSYKMLTVDENIGIILPNNATDMENNYSEDPYDIDLNTDPMAGSYSPDPYDVDVSIQQFDAHVLHGTHAASGTIIEHEDNLHLSTINNTLQPPTFVPSSEPTFVPTSEPTSIVSNSLLLTTNDILSNSGNNDEQNNAFLHTTKLSSSYLDSWMNKNDDNMDDVSSTAMLMLAKKNSNVNGNEDDTAMDTILENTTDIKPADISHGKTLTHGKAISTTIEGGYWKQKKERKENQESLMQELSLLKKSQQKILRNIDNNQTMIEDTFVTEIQQRISVPMKEIIENVQILSHITNDIQQRIINNTETMNESMIKERHSRMNSFEQQKKRMLEMEKERVKNNVIVDELRNELKEKKNIELKFQQFQKQMSDEFQVAQKNISLNVEQQIAVCFEQQKEEECKQNEDKKVFDKRITDGLINKQNEILMILKTIADAQHSINIQSNENERKNKTNVEVNRLSIMVNEMTEELKDISLIASLREEYNNAKLEIKAMHMEMHKYRNENAKLIVEKQKCEQELQHVINDKRSTMMNMMVEMDAMRQQIRKLSAEVKKSKNGKIWSNFYIPMTTGGSANNNNI